MFKPTSRLARGRRLRRLDCALQVAYRGLTEPLEAADAVVVEEEDVRQVLEQTELEEEPDPLLAESLDVHGAAGREVLDGGGRAGRGSGR